MKMKTNALLALTASLSAICLSMTGCSSGAKTEKTDTAQPVAAADTGGTQAPKKAKKADKQQSTATTNEAENARMEALASLDLSSLDLTSLNLASLNQASLDAAIGNVKNIINTAKAAGAEQLKSLGDARADEINANAADASTLIGASKARVLKAIQAKDDSKAGVAAAVDTAGADASARTAEAQKSFDDQLASAVQLTEEGKKSFKEASVLYGIGLLKLAPQATAATAYAADLKSQVQAAKNPLAKAKLAKLAQPVSALATTLPTKVSSALATGGRMIQYGVKNGVDMSNLQSVVDKYSKEAAPAQ